MRLLRDPVERFYEKVKILPGHDACHEWIAGTHHGGYGQYWYEGRNLDAHVAAWLLNKGPVPKGLCVLHHCDNPRCVRLSHLYVGTKQDNSNDMIARGRAVHLHGEAIASARLTVRLVLAIRKDKKTSKLTLQELAKKYQCHEKTIWSIVHFKAWKHVK